MSLYFITLLLASFSAKLVNCVDIQLDEGVLVLNKDNFDSAINDNENVLVEFYAPWCGHCKALAPEYAKAAKKLEEQGSAIKLAKVDATEESELAEKFAVRGYPTLKFFKRANALDYGGGRTADDIVTWLLKKTGPPAKILTTKDEALTFVNDNNVAIIGFFKDQESEKAKTFLNAAGVIDDQVFGITSDDAVFEEYKIDGDNQIVLFKKFDDGRAVLEGEITEASVKKFVATESLPLVVEFNHDTAQKIFGGDIKSHLLLFISSSSDEFTSVRDQAAEVAKGFRDQVLFVTINTDDDDHQRILEFFGMNKEEVPSMRLIKLEEEMSKYKPEKSDLTKDNIRSFVQDFIDGKLKQHYLAQELPEDWDTTPVKTLVATNFDEVVFNKDKDVLVEFYAPWCGHCKQLAPIYDQLGEHFKDDASIVVAKMDATANELEHTKITSFPTLKLYKKGDNQIIEYSGERTLEGLIKFLESGGSYGQAASDESEEEDEDYDLPRKDEL